MDLKDTVYAKAARFTVFYVSIIDGISPLISILISISPMFLAVNGVLEPDFALYTSIVVSILYLGVLGVFIGEFTGRNRIIESLKLMGIGLVTTILVSVILQPLPHV